MSDGEENPVGLSSRTGAGHDVKVKEVSMLGLSRVTRRADGLSGGSVKAVR